MRQTRPPLRPPAAGQTLGSYAWLVPLVGAGLLLRRRPPPGRVRTTAARLNTAQVLAALSRAGIGLARIGLDGRFLLFDARCRTMFGVGPGWAAGRSALELCPPEDQAAAHARFVRLVRTGEPFETVQRISRRDGGELWVHGSVSLGRDRRGQPQSALAVLRDVTEQRMAQVALRAAEQAVAAERTRVEQDLRGSQRMELLGQLAGGVAHDFNNVLQAIAGGARLIQRHAREPQVVIRLTELIVEAAERGAFVTQRLLAFARRGPLEPGPVDITLLLRQMQEVLARTLGEEVSITLDAPDELPPALADREQLEAVLVNIAANARDAILKAAAQGGPCHGNLVLRVAAERVDQGASHLAGLAAGAYVRLAAVDTGTGMGPAELARVTEPFFTTKPFTRGTGLSLAMARGFAEQSGGRLSVESARGQGTTVTLWLPQVAAAAATAGDR